MPSTPEQQTGGVLRRLGIYGLVLAAVFGVAFWAGTLVGSAEAGSAPAAVREQENR